MLGVFSSTVVSAPEELVAAGSRTPSPKTKSGELVNRFLKANPSAMSVQIGDDAHLAFTHNNQSPLLPSGRKRDLDDSLQRVNSAEVIRGRYITYVLQALLFEPNRKLRFVVAWYCEVVFMDIKDNGCGEDGHGGLQGTAIVGGIDEGAKYDSDKVSDDTEDLSDDKYLDISLENFNSLNGSEETGVTNTPTLGMTFESDEDAYDYYNSYARVIGFSVRKKRSYTFKNSKVICSREFCCSCEGFYQKKTTPEKKREETRFGCKAMFKIKLNEDGKFVVIKFEADHNHDLVPRSSSHAMRSQRKIEYSQGSMKNISAKTR